MYRALHRAQDIRRRLGGSANMLEQFPEKLKGMPWRLYERLFWEHHDTDNVSWSLFPNYGSHYDPAVTGAIAVIAAAIVTFIWGSRTLARYRHA